jgi:DNA-binding transcriptional regulator YiaG
MQWRYNPRRTHSDQEVTECLREWLGLETGLNENLATFASSLLRSKGFSGNDHYFRVFAKLAAVNTGDVTPDEFGAWLDWVFPGNGTWRDSFEQDEDAVNREVFGVEVSGRRKEMGLTRTELACRVGVSPSNVQRWEEGDTVPRDRTLIRLAHVLNMPPAELWCRANGLEY